jgi:hypothetical protein
MDQRAPTNVAANLFGSQRDLFETPTIRRSLFFWMRRIVAFSAIIFRIWLKMKKN